MTDPRQLDLVAPGAVLDRPVRCRVVLPDAPRPSPWALLVHGYTVSPEWGFWPELARRLAESGIASARVAFSGDGVGPDLRSVEDVEAVRLNTYVAELADLATARDLLACIPELDPERRALVGHSRGGGIGAIHAAEDGGYRAVALWAAFDRILRFAAERLEQWRREGSIDVLHHGLGRRVQLDVAVLDAAERARDRLDVLAACARLTCPLLVVHGTRDRSLPPSGAENIARAAPASELVLIEGAGHGFGARDPLLDIPGPLEQLLAVTVDWLGRELRSNPR